MWAPYSKDDHSLTDDDDENDHCPCEQNWNFDEWYDSKEESTDKVDMLPQQVFDQNFVRILMAKVIILHDLPLSIVEAELFESYMTTLNPLYRPMSVQEVSDEILRIYGIERTKTMIILKNIRSRFDVTTDVWISDSQYNKFLGVTEHFIDDSWMLKSRKMRFKYLEYLECKETCPEDLLKCFQDWSVDRKLSTLTVDNCINDDAMIQNLSDWLSCTSLVLGGRIFRLCCFANVLNLMVKDWFEVLDESIDRIRDSVGYWTSTPERKKKFEESARQLNIFCTKKFVPDFKTEWNSTYLMLYCCFYHIRVSLLTWKNLSRNKNVTSSCLKKEIGSWYKKCVTN